MSQDKKDDNPYKVNVESIESSEPFQTGNQVMDKGILYYRRDAPPYDYTHYHDGRNWHPMVRKYKPSQPIRQQPSPQEQPWTELLQSNRKLLYLIEQQTKVLYSLENKIDHMQSNDQLHGRTLHARPVELDNRPANELDKLPEQFTWPELREAIQEVTNPDPSLRS